jgi:hypothetical protein
MASVSSHSGRSVAAIPPTFIRRGNRDRRRRAGRLVELHLWRSELAFYEDLPCHLDARSRNPRPRARNGAAVPVCDFDPRSFEDT